MEVPARGVVIVLGVLATWGWFRVTTRAFARFVGQVPSDTVQAARGLAMTVFVTAGLLGALAALWTPLGLQLGPNLFVEFGGGFGATCLLLPAAGLVTSPRYSGPAVPWDGVGPSRRWMIAGAVATIVFVFGFGRGIAPDGYS